jgi:hypothetical protein
MAIPRDPHEVGSVHCASVEMKHLHSRQVALTIQVWAYARQRQLRPSRNSHVQSQTPGLSCS